jgi:CheY-like chemotaxis protein
MTRIEAGGIQINPSKMNLKETISQVCAPYSLLAKQKGIRVESIFPADLSPYILSDPTYIRQILNNLIGNAYKFTSQGQITVTTTKVGDNLEIQVSDTGPGIPADMQEEIFKPFTQVDSSNIRQQAGTGLGLTISSSLAKKLNGKLSLLSSSPQGSTFSLLILYIPTLPAQTEEQTPQTPPSKPWNIIIAEDNKINAKLLSAMLAKLGHHTVIAENGQECVKTFQSSPSDFHMIFMDLHMPIMDGTEATKTIKKINKNVWITAATAEVSVETQTLLSKAGVDDYISKPFNLEKISKCVTDAQTLRG